MSTTYNNQTTNNHVLISITTTTSTVGRDSTLVVAFRCSAILPSEYIVRQQYLYSSRKVSAMITFELRCIFRLLYVFLVYRGKVEFYFVGNLKKSV